MEKMMCLLPEVHLSQCISDLSQAPLFLFHDGAMHHTN
jgi:hypothetical protein